MKLFRIIPFLFLSVFFSSCIAQNEDCPSDRNIVLRLDLALDLALANGYNGNGRLGDYMEYADVFIFNAATGLLAYRTSTLVVGEYTVLSLNHLTPGTTYRIVAWGNATSPQIAFGNVNLGDHINNAYVGRAGVSRGTPPQPGDGDRLFFAPDVAQNAFTITIPQFGDLEETLSFARAYIGVEVTVLGYEGFSGESEPSIVEITGASSHFCFDRVPEGDISLRATTVVQTQYVERPAVAKFRTKLFDDNAGFGKELHIRSSQAGNAIRFTIDEVMLRQLVAQFMTDNNITSLKADGAPQRVIPITINFGVNVTVTVGVKDFELVEMPPGW